MYKFDAHYAVEMRKLICPEYNKNKIIYGQMYYVIDGYYK